MGISKKHEDANHIKEIKNSVNYFIRLLTTFTNENKSTLFTKSSTLT